MSARLLLPAIRWNATDGFAREREGIERAVDSGVGGFIIFGGDATAVRDLVCDLRAASRHPLLIGSDLERGAGQQFRGCISLPPAAAVASLQDLDVTERAGFLTGREARALGIDWVFAPVADVDLEPENPVIGTRAFGSDPAQVAAQVSAWIRGCSRAGALSCAKHFPGHGRTSSDSHVERPVVHVSREDLEQDLLPFRAAIEARVGSVMTAHVSYPALDPAGAPATLSSPILHGLLRESLLFQGLIVTDAMDMKGATAGVSEAEVSVRALEAGCDALLYTRDVHAVAASIADAVHQGRLPRSRVSDALERVELAIDSLAEPPSPDFGRAEDGAFAMSIALRSLVTCHGAPALPPGSVRVVGIDDDLGGPFPAYSREAFPSALRRLGVEVASQGSPLIALYADIRAWKGRPGISDAAIERVRAEIHAHPEAAVVLFSHPRLKRQLTFVPHLLAAWGGEALMQEAAAAWLTGTTGSIPQQEGGFER